MKAKIYQAGNAWQKKVYSHMSKFLESEQEIKDFGVSRNGNKYKHLLREEDARYNFITDAIFLG